MGKNSLVWVVSSALLRRQYQEGPFWSLVKLATGRVLLGALPLIPKDLSHYGQRQAALVFGILDNRARTTVQDAAHEVKSTAHIQIADIDVPMLVGSKWLRETTSILGSFSLKWVCSDGS